MATLVFKNTNVTTPLQVDDLGIYLEPNEDLDLLSNFRDEDILESLDLQTAMSGDSTVTLNGSISMTYQDVIDYLTKLTHYDVIDYAYITSEDSTTDITSAELEQLTDGSDITLHNHDNRYYTQTQLQTSGQSAVHWGNITNAPAFGAPSWRDPVLFMLNGKGTTTSMNSSSLAEGDTWWNTDDDHIYKYDGSIWIDQGTPSSNDRIIFKDGTGSDDKIYTFDGSSWGSGITPENNWAVMVDDDGDGKPAQYIYDESENNWVKIADVDWYQASFIHVTPTSDISSTNVQDALEELMGDINNIINGNIDIDYSLDDAYNDGSIITVDDTNVVWNLNDNKEFSINSDVGSTEVFNVSASGGGDVVTINGTLDQNGPFDFDGAGNSSIQTSGGNLTLGTLTSGNVVLNSAGSMTFDDQYLTTAINLSEPGVSSLDPSISATSIIGAINELAGEINSVTVTLDEAYDGPSGSGSGKTIIADNGAVVINSTSSSNAPLQLNSQSAAPTTSLAAGQLSVINGELYLYDATRSKWLSITESNYYWADDNIKGKYMKIGDALGTNVGFTIPANATIVKVSCSESTGSNRELQLRKNGSPASIKTFNLSAGSYTSTNDNIDLLSGDIMQAYVSGGSGSPCKDLVVNVFLKYRA